MIQDFKSLKFNSFATFLVAILAANAIIAFVSLGFFFALVQVGLSALIAYLGSKAQIWKE